MELQQIKQFKEIARTENISKAAEMLGLTQATLSQNLKRLEDELGVQLFERVTYLLLLFNCILATGIFSCLTGIKRIIFTVSDNMGI